MGKRVWIFNHYAGPPSILSKTRHYCFGKYLVRDGYSPVIFAASAIHNTDLNLIDKDGPLYIQEDSDEIPFVFIKTRQYRGNGIERVLNMLDYYRRLFSVVKNFEKPDVIIASSVHPLTCVAGIKIAKKLGIKCICEIRDLWPESIVAYNSIGKKNILIKMLYKMEKWIYKNANALIFTMPGGIDYIRDQGWEGEIPLEKIHHINNGIDLEDYEMNATQYPFEDVDLDNPDIFKVVHTGSIRKANNIPPLVDVAVKLKSRGSRAKLLFWGEGDDVSALQARIQEANIDNIIYKGNVQKKYIPSLLNKSNVNLLHVQKTNILKYGLSANKVFDYLASGKPIISDVASAHDVISEWNCGTIIDNNFESLANEIFALENATDDKYNRLCVNAKEASEYFSFRNLTYKLESIMEEVVKS